MVKNQKKKWKKENERMNKEGIQRELTKYETKITRIKKNLRKFDWYKLEKKMS